MTDFKNKLMALIDTLKRRLERHKGKRKDLENLVDRNAATPNQKQRYVEIKAKEEELEDVIDLTEGIIEEDK